MPIENPEALLDGLDCFHVFKHGTIAAHYLCQHPTPRIKRIIFQFSGNFNRFLSKVYILPVEAHRIRDHGIHGHAALYGLVADYFVGLVRYGKRPFSFYRQSFGPLYQKKS